MSKQANDWSVAEAIAEWAKNAVPERYEERREEADRLYEEWRIGVEQKGDAVCQN